MLHWVAVQTCLPAVLFIPPCLLLPCSPTKVSPSITIKEECVLLNIGGVRGERLLLLLLLLSPT